MQHARVRAARIRKHDGNDDEHDVTPGTFHVLSLRSPSPKSSLPPEGGSHGVMNAAARIGCKGEPRVPNPESRIPSSVSPKSLQRESAALVAFRLARFEDGFGSAGKRYVGLVRLTLLKL
jgi:hypothetical protein